MGGVRGVGAARTRAAPTFGRPVNTGPLPEICQTGHRDNHRGVVVIVGVPTEVKTEEYRLPSLRWLSRSSSLMITTSSSNPAPEWDHPSRTKSCWLRVPLRRMDRRRSLTPPN